MIPPAAWIMLLPSDVARLVLGRQGRGKEGYRTGLGTGAKELRS